ncbi:MAG: DUF3192 domain-containing protein [Candidatus Omnitrophica bacterium]|nr:DUF3192 domain-containing protein [Candidatus Omnitrophota bacterium]
MKKFFIGLYCLALSGCVSVQTLPDSPQGQGAGRPDPRLTRVGQTRVGMTYLEAAAAMGEKTVIGYERLDPRSEAYTPITVNNPYRKEFLRVAGKSYDVFYYFTNIRKADGIISDDELTPLVFENNVLIGEGRDFLNTLKSR